MSGSDLAETGAGSLVPAGAGASDLAAYAHEQMRVAAEVAKVLNDAIVERGFIAMIQGRQHPTIEAWLLLADLVGVTSIIRWCRPITLESGEVVGWEARAELVNRDGILCGGAESMALREEQDTAARRSWTSSQHGMRSMAETRATSKALSLRFRHVVKLAGYDPNEPGGGDENGERERVPAPYRAPAPAKNPEDEPGSVSLEREAEVANRLAAIGVKNHAQWLNREKVPTRYHLSNDDVWRRVTEALERAEGEAARAEADHAHDEPDA